MGSEIDNFHQTVNTNCMKLSGCGGSFSRPAFPETIVIIVPFGPSGCLKYNLFDADLLMFGFVLLLCVCVLFCTTFLHFFHNTTVNAKPLSPPNFEKIAQHFKSKHICFYFGSLHFFMFVDFRIPLAPPWARLVPFVA